MLIKSDKVLIVTAHPDDAEIGMGMRIIQHDLDGNNVYLLIATNGEHEECPRGRKTEAKKAAKTLGIKECRFLDLPCGRLNEQCNELRGKIESFVKNINPDIIYTIFPNDLHVDHVVISEETLSAARSVPTLFFFRVAYSRQFNPNFFFFGTQKLMQRKLEALKCYKNEIKREGSLNLEVIENLAKVEMHRYFHHKALSKIQNRLKVHPNAPLFFEPFLVERICCQELL